MRPENGPSGRTVKVTQKRALQCARLRSLGLRAPIRGRPSNRFGEAFVGVPVATLVPSDLLGPVPAVDGVASPAVLGTTVPEAAINEYRHPPTGEDDVCGPIEVRKWSQVYAIAQSASPQRTTEGHLWP